MKQYKWSFVLWDEANTEVHTSGLQLRYFITSGQQLELETEKHGCKVFRQYRLDHYRNPNKFARETNENTALDPDDTLVSREKFLPLFFPEKSNWNCLREAV